MPYTLFHETKNLVRETSPFLILTTSMEIIAGYFLMSSDILELLPGLLVLIPGLMTLRGNISSSLSQRLGSAVHLGLIPFQGGLNKDLLTNEELLENVKATVILNGTVVFFIATGSFAFCWVLGFKSISLLGLLVIALLVAFISGGIQISVTIGVAIYAARNGLDPDNITIPILAAIGDILTISILLIVVHLVIFVDGYLPFL
ncbi:MAG: magnesium transporter [Promethearchaeota archaeon]